jgi:GT2 family glycosyltransferase
VTAATLCIVNHNGASHLAHTLPGIAALGDCVDEIVLLDNASTDSSRELFLSLIPTGRIVQLDQNRSPGAARNAGFSASRNDRVLFADNDISLGPGAVGELFRALEQHSDAVIALPRVILTRRPDFIQYEGAYCHWLGHMVLRHEDAPAGEPGGNTEGVDSMVSACFAVDRRRWRAPEFFDPGYRFYYEDHDVGVRARLSGAQLLAVPTAVVMHGDGTPNLSMRPGGRYAPRRIQTLIEGRWRHLIKNLSVRGFCVLGPGLFAYELLQLGGVLLKGWGPHWWIALRYTLRSRGELMAQRRRIQGSRRIADRELLRGGDIPFKPELAGGRGTRLALRACNRLFEWYWRIARRWL